MNYLFSLFKNNNPIETNAYLSIFGNDIAEYGCHEILSFEFENHNNFLLLDFDKENKTALFKVVIEPNTYFFNCFNEAFIFFEKNKLVNSF